MKAEIERKISEYAVRLVDLNGPDDKRVKKRILQALGKLKKQLASLDSSSVNCSVAEEDDEANDNADTLDESIDSKATDVVLSRKHLKAKLKLLNKELADYAQKKQLKLAVKRFSWGVRKGMEPDKHTYANLLNCYVRCGDLDGALQQFKLMRDAKLSPNIVIYTTLLKGFCDRGDLAGAQNLLFSEIPNNKVSIGIRTVNTFVRGCTKIGAVNSALRAYRMLQDSSKSSVESIHKSNLNNGKKRKRDDNIEEVDDDDDNDHDDNENELINAQGLDGNNLDENDGKASLFESLVALLCQSLDADQAALLAVEAVTSLESAKNTNSQSKNNSTTDCAIIYVNLSKVYLFTGRYREAEKWIECAIAALEASKNSQLRNSMQQNRENQTNLSKENGKGSNGKDNSKRTRSIDLFLRHKRAEIETEVESINESLSVIRSTVSNLQSKSSNRKDNLDLVTSSRLGLFQTLSRVLYFGFDGNGDLDQFKNTKKKKNPNEQKEKSGKENKIAENSQNLELSTNLIFALRDKFGLDRIERLNNSQNDYQDEDKMENANTNNNKLPNIMEISQENQIHQKALKLMKKETVNKMLRIVNNDTGYINYSELFRNIILPLSSSSKPTISGNGMSSDEEEESHHGYNSNNINNDDDDKDDDDDDDDDILDINKIPVNIEICSGSGEWVVAHAAADLYHTPKNEKNKNTDSKNTNLDLNEKQKFSSTVPRALWLALELRCDRVYHTICRSILENIVQHSHHTKAQIRNKPFNIINHTNIEDEINSVPLSFSGLSNLAIIGGDASNILPNRIAPLSITSVYINHPEPPERTGGVGDSEGKHLLTQDFFNEIHRILIPLGTCTIVTDNLPYAKSLLQALAKTSQNSIKLASTSSLIIPSFVSVPLDSLRNNDKSDKRVLEDEIQIGIKLTSRRESTDEKSLGKSQKTKKGKKNKKKLYTNESDNDNEDDDKSSDDDDDEDENRGNDGYSYINDENAIISDDTTSIKSSIKNQCVNDNRKKSNNVVEKNKTPVHSTDLPPLRMKGDEVQVLQLWRGDSAEIDGNDDSALDNTMHVSSYFDRMWERGQKKRRWFIILKKSI